MDYNIELHKNDSTGNIDISVPTDVTCIHFYNSEGELIDRMFIHDQSKPSIKQMSTGYYFLHFYFPNHICIKDLDMNDAC